MPPRKKAEPAPEPEAVEAVEIPEDIPPEADETAADPPTIGSLDYNPDGGRVLIDQR